MGSSFLHSFAGSSFVLAAYFSEPLFDSSYHCYDSIQKCSTTEGLIETGTTAFKGALYGVVALIAAIPFASLSILFSTAGATALKISGKPYVYHHIEGNLSKPSSDKLSVVSYNIGLLAGGIISRRCMVGEFGCRSFAEEKALLLKDVTNLCENNDLIILQEAHTTLFLRDLQKNLQTLNQSFHIYSRISENPLQPGITSGIVMISKVALQNITVKNLSNTEPFFNRAAVYFSVTEQGKSIHFAASHLKIPETAEEHYAMIQEIYDSAPNKAFVYVGDFNLSVERGEKLPSALDYIPKIPAEVATMRTETKEDKASGETFTERNPDTVATTKNFEVCLGKIVDVVVKTLFRYSDHFPFSFTAVYPSLQAQSLPY